MKFDFKKLILAGVLALTTHQAHAISLDFNSISGANLKFFAVNDTFQVLDKTTAGAGQGFSFQISASDGVGDSLGDYGKISGTYTIGAITTLPGGLQSANVTGSGTLTIRDHLNQLLTGTIVWNTIYTLNTAGAMNSIGGVNLSSISYNGVEQDLIGLSTLQGQAAVATLQFGFTPARSLTSLTTGTGTRTTSFSGDLDAVPPVPDGGATVGLLGLGLLALGTVRRKKT